MSHWNHRVIKRTHNNGIETEDFYGIHEVFYNDDGSIYSYTKEPVEAVCESLEDLREYVQWMLNCIDKEVLVEGKFELVDPPWLEDNDAEKIEDIEDLLAVLNEYEIKVEQLREKVKQKEK